MVKVAKRIVEKQIYYYLEHTFRMKGKVQKKERYLGKEIPKNIEELKRHFLNEIYKEKWYPLFDKIKGNYAKDIQKTPASVQEAEQKKFTIHFTYDTQRIEGSPLTLRETADLLERGITPKAKPLRDSKEAEAHKSLVTEIITTKKDFSLSLVLHWHKRLFQETRLEIAGKIREHQVAISGSKFIPPSPVEIDPLLTDFFQWYKKNKSIIHPVELAALVHLKLVTIHPFADGNGRISRLAMNFILHQYGYPMVIIHYEGRTSYYTALERAQTKNQEFIFVQWLFRRYCKEYSRLL